MGSSTYVMKNIFLFLAMTMMVTAKTHLLFYCGITMVPAIMDVKKRFEKTHHCTITLIQGGSKDLCKSIQATHQGDLFLPGKDSYIDQCGEAGYVLRQRTVGYNRLALFVPKGNPKQIKGLDDLLRPDLLTTLGNPETCSIGKAAKETLLRYGGTSFLDNVHRSLGLFSADSRDMNHLLLTGQADVGLNWIASLHALPQNDRIEVIPVFDLYSQPQTLVVAALQFSLHPKLAQAFVDYLASPYGKKIMQKYGFGHE